MGDRNIFFYKSEFTTEKEAAWSSEGREDL